MRELQLVGYTADFLHLVFTDAAESGGRFKAPIDEDFVATLTEVLDMSPEAAPLSALRPDLLASESSESPEPSEPTPAPEPDAESPAEAASGNGEVSPDGAAVLRGAGPMAGMAAAARGADDEGEAAPSSDRPRPSSLAPREIQSLLRAGQGTRSVAKQAGTDEWWVRRWLPPIEAEREQVLQAVRASFVAKTRLGVSAEPVGEAVEHNLAAKGVHPDDPSVEWLAARREGDPYWQVTLRYRSRGRAQRATWRFNPETGALDPRNDLAVSVAWTRTRKRTSGRATSTRSATRTGRRSSSGAKGTKAGKAAGKKAAGKKSPGKKAAGKKAAGKKAAGKKAAPAKKAAGKKAAPAKKTAGKKAAGKKAAPAKKAAGKKTTAKKTAAKKATPAEKSAAKKATPAEKSAASKATAKKSAPAKKATAKKVSSKRASSRSAAQQ